MQSSIDNILHEDLSKSIKISKLNSFFQNVWIKWFVDFDDTITQVKDIFYSKNKLFNDSEKYWDNRLTCFKVNDNFVNLAKKLSINEIVILSRNYEKFLLFFIKKTKKYFESFWIKIVGCVWSTKYFSLSSYEKMLMVPKSSYIITDMFEYKKLKKYSNVLFIEEYNVFEKYLRYIKKIFYLIRYFLYDRKVL